MKKVLLLLISFIFFIHFSFAAPSVNVSNIFIEENYSFGDSFRGNFSLTLLNFEPDYYFKTSKGHSISLLDFFRLNNYTFSCSRFNCENIFINSSSCENNLSISLNSFVKNSFGFFVNEPLVNSINEIELKLRLNLEESEYIPLKIKIKNKTIWSFFEENNNFTRFESYGCFNPSESFEYNKRITELPFCERMANVPPLKKILVGANFSNPRGETRNLRMSLVDARNREEIGFCTFNPSQTNYCIITLNRGINEIKDYLVCISSPNETNIFLGFQQKVNSCGFYYNSLSQGDYAIFLKLPYFSKKENFTIELKEGRDFEAVNELNNYLSRVYRNNCTFGCFFPLTFEGVSQNIELLESRIIYQGSSGQTLVNKICPLIEKEPLENFSGILNLNVLDFKINFSGSSPVQFFLEKENITLNLFSKRVNIFQSSIKIFNVIPKTIPLFIPTKIFLDFENRTNVTDFFWLVREKNSSEEIFRKNSREPYVDLILKNNSVYELFVEVTGINNSRDSSKFIIETRVPTKEEINSSLSLKREKILNLRNSIERFYPSLKDLLINLTEINKFEETIQNLALDLSSITTDEEKILLARRTLELNVPFRLVILNKEENSFLGVDDSSKISSSIITSFSRKNKDLEKYKDYVNSYSLKSMLKKDLYLFSLTYENLSEKNLPLIVRIRGNTEDAYLIIQDNNLFFSSLSLENISEGKKIRLNKSQQIDMFFLSFSEKPLVYLVPLNLSSVELSFNVTPCNYNKVCEENENYKNCRSDCKPWGITIFLLGITFVFFIISYTFIQERLKKKYEESLFKSRRDLLNLISFFKSTTEEKALSREEAFEKLRKAGWSEKQIEYAYKKSRGERTRPYEIIPFEKVKSLLSKNARKN